MRLHELLKLERPLLGVDLETTGTNPKTCGICEIGLEIMIPGKPVKEYRTLVNPIMPIPPEATAIHGITNDMVADAPTFLQLADNLSKGMANCDFVGYSVRFDLRQLVEEFLRAKRPFTLDGAKIIDGFRIWQIAEGRTLEHAVDRWLKRSDHDIDREAVTLEGKAHNALWDVKMTTRVVAAQLRACPQLPRDVAALHALCWPDWFDNDGKLKWRNGELCFGFGAHRDKPLRSVPKGYLKWVVQQDFSPLVKDTCINAAAGIYPKQESHVQDN